MGPGPCSLACTASQIELTSIEDGEELAHTVQSSAADPGLAYNLSGFSGVILSEGQKSPEGDADAMGPVSLGLTHWIVEKRGKEGRSHWELSEGLGSCQLKLLLATSMYSGQALSCAALCCVGVHAVFRDRETEARG